MDIKTAVGLQKWNLIEGILHVVKRAKTGMD